MHLAPAHCRLCTRERKTTSRNRFFGHCAYRIASRSDQFGKLLVGNLQTLTDDSNLYAVNEVKPVAVASDVASVHSHLLYDCRKDQAQTGFRPSAPDR